MSTVSFVRLRAAKSILIQCKGTNSSTGHLLSITDRSGGVTRFRYDATGNLASLADPVGNTTSWSYDQQHRLAQETDALGASRYFAYNELGKLWRFTDRTGQVRQYQYDASGKIAAETWYAGVEDADAGADALDTILYQRDSAGRITLESDNLSSVVYVYNDAGQITSTTQSSLGGPTVTLTYQYDTGERRTQMAATIDGVADFVEDYGYDAEGRVVSVLRHGVAGGNAVAEQRLELAYDAAGRLTSLDRYLAGQVAVEADYDYDSFGRLVGLVYRQGATVLNSYAWTYSADGEQSRLSSGENAAVAFMPSGGLLPVHDLAGVTAALISGGLGNLALVTSCTSSDGTASYRYDPTGQLLGATYTGGQAEESYAWDANGNRMGAGYVVGAGNRMLSDGTYWYQYDAEGNRTARFLDVDGSGDLSLGDTQVTAYAWDARNRLVRAADYAAQGGAATQIVSYLYDVENRWIGEDLDSDGDGDVDHQTRFAYDGNQIVLQFERDGESAVTGADLSHRYLWEPGVVDQLLADERTHLDGSGNVATQEVLWPLTDNLGTVRDLAVFNGETTGVVDHVIYDSFGKVTSESDASQGSLFGFTGRPESKATGLRNHLNRWTDPRTADWLSEDPSGFTAGDTNTRRYCGNSPTNVTDPTGLDGTGGTTDADRAILKERMFKFFGGEATDQEREEYFSGVREGFWEGMKSWVELAMMAFDAHRQTLEFQANVSGGYGRVAGDRIASWWYGIKPIQRFEMPALPRYVQVAQKKLEELSEIGMPPVTKIPGIVREMASVTREMLGICGQVGGMAWDLRLATADPNPAGHLAGHLKDKVSRIIDEASPTLVRLALCLTNAIATPRQRGYVAGMVLYQVAESVVVSTATLGVGAIIEGGVRLPALLAKLRKLPFLAKDARVLKEVEQVASEVRILGRSAEETAAVADSLRAPSSGGLARIFAKTRKRATKFLGAGEGITDKWGNIRYSLKGTADEVALARYHERVHSLLSPKFTVLREMRADLRMLGYQKSSFLRYVEEALAETYAQLRVNGVKGLLTGISFPVKKGYVTLSNVIREGALGTIVVGGVTYGVYYFANE